MNYTPASDSVGCRGSAGPALTVEKVLLIRPTLHAGQGWNGIPTDTSSLIHDIN